MAEKLENYDFATWSHGSKYDRYIDGSVWRLELGVDVSGNATAIRAAILRAAERKGLKLRASMRQAGFLIVQAYPPEGA